MMVCWRWWRRKRERNGERETERDVNERESQKSNFF